MGKKGWFLGGFGGSKRGGFGGFFGGGFVGFFGVEKESKKFVKKWKLKCRFKWEKWYGKCVNTVSKYDDFCIEIWNHFGGKNVSKYDIKK